MMQKVKKQYFEQQINIHQSSHPQTWNLVNKLMNTSHTKYTPNAHWRKINHLICCKSRTYAIIILNQLV